ncbi:MmcQ/YjbR family DNA-binding protein [Acrocarpospora macrocephala]|uniref:MmcQ/YjbR family DNA-binding protein n=1 Tax=Acrocarpospora macrocephala TaxID=150177 RepID=UPI001FEBA910|nr:MmcQ/YjbR family DNA-binding protein [Acrocarpospora macrocephala]
MVDVHRRARSYGYRDETKRGELGAELSVVVVTIPGMVTVELIRAVALGLPRTTEHLIRDRVKFRVGSIVYVAVSPDETSMGFGFPKEERAALIKAEPEKFFMPRPSDERYRWVQAWLGALDEEEARELVIEAWRMCVPKKISALVP